MRQAESDGETSKDGPAGSGVKHAKLLADVLLKLRLMVNVSRRHFRGVQNRSGLSGARMWALFEICDAPGLAVSQLAAAMAIHQSTASALVDQLVESGHVRRARSSTDRRIVRLYPSKRGSAIATSVPRLARAPITEALAQLPVSMLARLREDLSLLLARLHTLRAARREPGAATRKGNRHAMSRTARKPS